LNDRSGRRKGGKSGAPSWKECQHDKKTKNARSQEDRLFPKPCMNKQKEEENYTPKTQARHRAEYSGRKKGNNHRVRTADVRTV